MLLYIDGTQSLGALRFDVARVRPDMFAVHGYKWMLSPNGAGFFYIAPQLRERLPPNVVGWRSHWDWRNVDNLHHGVPEFTSTAEKYEGGSVIFALLYAMEASVDLMFEIGPEVIEQRVLGLADATRGMLRGLGASVADGASPIVAAKFENRDVSALARALKEQRVLVAARRGHLRVSPHLYNNEQDLEIFERTLRSVALARQTKLYVALAIQPFTQRTIDRSQRRLLLLVIHGDVAHRRTVSPIRQHRANSAVLHREQIQRLFVLLWLRELATLSWDLDTRVPRAPGLARRSPLVGAAERMCTRDQRSRTTDSLL